MDTKSHLGSCTWPGSAEQACSSLPLRGSVTQAVANLGALEDILGDSLARALILGLILVAYFTKGRYWAIPKGSAKDGVGKPGNIEGGSNRDFVEGMKEMGKNCIIFFGSQTGTAESYASRLAKEGKTRFGLETMVADLENYDFDNLDSVPRESVVIFVLATYGEGEPTDNAVEFHEYISGELGGGPRLDNLRYVAFGLGNSTYEHYNSMVRNVTQRLDGQGAKRIGSVGEGDDGGGTMEEDFLAWKDTMWAALLADMGLQEHEATYEPAFSVTERADLNRESDELYLGEPNQRYLGDYEGPFDAHNPYIAPVVESRELFSGLAQDRHCIHMEIDLGGTNLSYKTGDHLAIWPTNPNDEVNCLMRILGLEETRHSVIGVVPLESTAKVPFPSPTTYDAIARYYLEICAPVSRQLVSDLAPFSPNDEAKNEMTRLGSDKEYFHEQTRFLNLARLLMRVSRGVTWDKIPFSMLIEGLTRLQPRYYSISSSSLAHPNRVSITVAVKTDVTSERGAHDPFCGVASNYLFALKRKQNNDPSDDVGHPTYDVRGPRNKFEGIRAPIHIRHSNFSLPSDPATPIIMVGPGTGVAPFRGFVQERTRQFQEGVSIGHVLLFFGCRRRTEDFLYESEWKASHDGISSVPPNLTGFFLGA